jgi:short-subunit dehydrogenase
LARSGADVTLAVRNTSAGDDVAADIAESTGSHNIHVAHLDLADRASIAAIRRELVCACYPAPSIVA